MEDYLVWLLTRSPPTNAETSATWPFLGLMPVCPPDSLTRQGKALKPMPKKNAWLAPILGKEAVPADESDLNSVETIWLPNATIARKWMHYIRDTKIPDSTPPPAPKGLKYQEESLRGRPKLILRADFPLHNPLQRQRSWQDSGKIN